MNRWHNSIAATFAGLMTTILATPFTAMADEETITIDQAPAAVQATILKQAAGATITEVERETKKDGRVIYEAEFRVDGQEIEIEVAEDGTLLSRESESDDDDLALDQIPQPARQALLHLANGAEIVEVERETEHGAEVFEAEWKAGGVAYEATVTATGDVLEIEERVAAADAPQAVRDAIAANFPAGAKIVIEKKTIYVYEVEARIDGREKEIMVLPTGKVLSAAQAGDDDDDHADGDDDDDGDDD